MENYKKTRFQYTNSRHTSKNKKGFDYGNNGNLLRKSISSFFYTEEKRSLILDKFSSMFSFVVDTVKHIRKQYMITVDKNENSIN